jgi:adenylate cyclase
LIGSGADDYPSGVEVDNLLSGGVDNSTDVDRYRLRSYALTVGAPPCGILLRRRRARAIAWLAATLMLSGCSALDRVDDRLFDVQAGLIRAWRQPAAPAPGPDVLIVGLDQATLDRAGVPMALVHRVLGQALDTISSAGASAIAIDLVLPERSFDHVVPGSDAALIRALSAARQRTHVVFVLEPDAGGHLRAPFTPFAAAVGEHGLVTAQLPVDRDGVVRRFDPGLSVPGLRTLAGEISYRLGRAANASEPGWIDYTRGAAFTYIPLIEVAEAVMPADAARVRQQFEGRVVVIGSVLPYADSVAQPVSLLAWEYPKTAPPAVVVHAQLLRSVLGAGLIRAVPAWLIAALVLAFALVGGLSSTLWRWIALALAIAAGMLLATLLHALGWRLGLAAPGAAGLLAASVRTSLDVASAQRERARLARTFGGYVSPQVFEAIVSGRLGTGAGRREMAFLFADLRGFTAWSEATEPGRVFEVLNRYFAAVTPYIHRHGGTIDNFRGDGLMVLFGAPDAHPDPCRAAFDAARDIVEQGRKLLDAVPDSAQAGLDLAVGISYGEAVYGDLGSGERKDFTAIGDAVNIAARLQDLSKSLGYPVLMTMEVFERLGAMVQRGADGRDAAPRPLGEVALRGHSAVSIAGWRAAA